MEIIIGLSIVAVAIFIAYRSFKKSHKDDSRGDNGGSEGDNTPQNPNYPAQQ